MGNRDRTIDGQPTNIQFNNDGTVWKKHEWYSKHKITFPIFKKYELNFIPKILEWNDIGYRYEYVNGPTIFQEICLAKDKRRILTPKMILEIKIAWDDILKKLYQISIENLEDDYFLWYNDPHLDNLIWRDDTKELIFLDIDSFDIGKYIPISYLNNILIQQLETRMITRNLNEY